MSDFDGDIICTINNPIIIKGKIDALPIMYESNKSKKEKVDSRDDKKQVESQLLGYNSKVGFATNISSSMYTMLEEFPLGSPERNAILNRLKIGRVIQGEIIDSVKGLHTPPFREHWTKFKHITEDMTEEEKAKWNFNNRILCEIRPAYFRFLYSHYMTKWNKEVKRYNIYSHLMFKKSFEDVCVSPHRTNEENRMIENYKWNSFFLDNNSVVNKISRYMRTTLALVGKYSVKESKGFDYSTLMGEFTIDQEMVNKMSLYLQQYKTYKRGMWHDLENAFENLDLFVEYLRKKCSETISSNDSELATYAVLCTYGKDTSAIDFAWKLFPEGIIQNITVNSDIKMTVPIEDKNGKIEYLWNNYTLEEFSPKEVYEN